MIKAAIFDLDGTLIDSEPYWKEADLLLAKKYEYSINDDFRKELKGRGVKECSEIFIKAFKLKMTNEDFTTERMLCVHKILFENLKLMPFAKQIIELLKKEGLVLALATAGHEKEATERILRELSIRSYFSYVMSGFDVSRSKPAPDIYLETARKINLQPNYCIVVEDSVNGVVSGKAAGMKVIGVNEEKDKMRELKEAGADFVFADLNVSKNLLDTILK